MARILFSQYHKEDLLELTERLNKDYYVVIDELCSHASVPAAELRQKEDHPSSSLYIGLCVKLIEEIRFHIRMRRQVLLPYIHELVKKTQLDHNCMNCQGNCDLQHGATVLGIQEAHTRIKEILYRLQQLAKPLYLDNAQPLSYKILRNEIIIIETALTEMFYLEEAILLPRIIESQNRINAAGK